MSLLNLKESLIQFRSIFYFLILSTNSFASNEMPYFSEQNSSKQSIQSLFTSYKKELLKGCDFSSEEEKKFFQEIHLTPFLNQTLSPLWAHHLIGNDLTFEFMSTQTSIQTTSIGIVDHHPYKDSIPIKNISSNDKKSYFESTPKEILDQTPHGSTVLSLILGGPFIGSAFQSHLVLSLEGMIAVGGQKPTYLCSDLAEKINQTSAKIVNFSMNFYDEKEILENFLKIPNETIFIASSGNLFNAKIDINTSTLEKLNKVIIVGSLSPLGMMSGFSQGDDEINVLAPSDYFIPSINFNGKINYFSGTSAAAPLVTGSLANVISFLPTLTTEEAKILLSRTALPSAESYSTKKTPPKVLNSYKLVRVASRLQNQHWEKLSSSERKHLLNQPETYDFKEESKQKFKTALELFSTASSTSELKSVLDYARQSFLLHYHEEAREFLEMIYSLSQVSSQSFYYRHLKLNDNNEKWILDILKVKSAYLQSALLRFIPFSPLTFEQNTTYLMNALDLIHSENDIPTDDKNLIFRALLYPGVKPYLEKFANEISKSPFLTDPHNIFYLKNFISDESMTFQQSFERIYHSWNE